MRSPLPGRQATRGAASFAGSAAVAAMSKMKDDERQALSERVRRACVSDPLGKKKRRVAAR